MKWLFNCKNHYSLLSHYYIVDTSNSWLTIQITNCTIVHYKLIIRQIKCFNFLHQWFPKVAVLGDFLVLFVFLFTVETWKIVRLEKWLLFCRPKKMKKRKKKKIKSPRKYSVVLIPLPSLSSWYWRKCLINKNNNKYAMATKWRNSPSVAKLISPIVLKSVCTLGLNEDFFKNFKNRWPLHDNKKKIKN